MKHFALSLRVALCALFAQTVHAQIENHFFEVTLKNTFYWDKTSEEQTEIARAAQASIDHWEILLANYKDSFNTSNKIKVTLEFKELGTDDNKSTTVAYAAPSFTRLIGGGVIERDGEKTSLTYDYEANAYAKLMGNATYDAVDIAITVNDYSSLHFQDDYTDIKYRDFETVFLHELTHGMGFVGSQYAIDGNGNYQPRPSFGTPFDALITEGLAGQPFTLGQEILITEGDYALFNPDPASTSSISHFDNRYTDALMMRSFRAGQVIRELTDMDIAVFRSMGLDLIPEPSSVVLVLLATPACLLRRRRTA